MVGNPSLAVVPLLLFAFAVSILLFDAFRFIGAGYSVFFSDVSPAAKNFGIHVQRPSPHPPMPQPRPAAGINGTIQCDRTSSHRTDVCIMIGDVRIHPPSSTIFLADAAALPSKAASDVERIRPYPRKFEPGIMKTVKELRLVTLTPTSSVSVDAAPECDVRHDAPALLFYAGGYTGNLFHEFTDGMVPLYLTSRHFRGRVVFVVIRYRAWWEGKYKEILSALSDYPLVDFDRDNRTHCFPRAVVGLRSYGDLALGPERTDWSNAARDFRNILASAYLPRLKRNAEGSVAPKKTSPRPHLVLISRKGTRSLENQRQVAAAARRAGFATVTVVQPGSTTALATMYGLLSTADAVAGVHGAALTHMVFMRRGAVLVQVVPLGIAWAAEVCFGRPARAMGLWYVDYRVHPHESSLSERYAADDPVLTEPDRVAAKGGWKVTNDVYLANQTIRLDLQRFGKVLARAYNLSMLRT